MRILFLTNNENTKSLVNWLRSDAGEEVTVTGDKLTEGMVASHKPDFVISYNYKHIISEDVLNLLPKRVINLHASLLPWNRGAYPNIWSFLQGTPKGVTIHLIDKGLDTGDVLIQKEVEISENETLASSYGILQKEMQSLFKSNWSEIKSFKVSSKSQPPGGSVHFIKDFENIRNLLGNKGWNITIRELKDKFGECEGNL